MHPLDVRQLIQIGIISSCGNDGNAASTICTTTYEVVIFIFIEILVDEEQKVVSVFWEYADGCVQQVVEIELSGEPSVQRRTRSNAYTFCVSIETDEGRDRCF